LKVWIRRYGLAYAEFFSHGQLPARRERGNMEELGSGDGEALRG
jgi:hypothetical protein